MSEEIYLFKGHIHPIQSSNKVTGESDADFLPFLEKDSDFLLQTILGVLKYIYEHFWEELSLFSVVLLLQIKYILKRFSGLSSISS